MNQQTILIVDDEADIRHLIRGILEDESYAVFEASDARQAYQAMTEKKIDLVILDIWLQGSEHDGLQILDHLKAKHKSVPVLMISGHGTIETAVQSIQKGAYDFIEKPFKADRLILMIRRALEAAELKRENEALKKTYENQVVRIIGSGHESEGIRNALSRVAPTNSRVLLTGEAGSGKNIAARFIHQNSARATKPFMALNCASLSPERLELELFGSAMKEGEQDNDSGILQQVNGGTLLLDEVSDMPVETQAKILRVLQEDRFQKIGSAEKQVTDVRILAATNKNLPQEIAAGRFREDLYYRLNVVQIEMPALRTRIKDLPALAQYFSEDFKGRTGHPVKPFSEDALSVMKRYKWPGNIRQLSNVVEWVCIMHGGSEDSFFMPEHLPSELLGNGEKAGQNGSAGLPPATFMMNLPLRDAREQFERDYIRMQIERFDGNISKTAEFIGMERSALHRKIKALQLIGDDTESVDEPEQAVASQQQKRA